MKNSNYFSFRPHPWHGLPIGEKAPQIVKAYIEIAPNEVIKYEVCKKTGYLKVDRPQKFSSTPSFLYGFIPQTYCSKKVAQLSEGANKGDGDPLDICVLSELPINKSDIILDAKIIGGLRLIDQGEADDKIIAVLNQDPFYEKVNSINQLHQSVLDRLQHYFLSYKNLPGEISKIKIDKTYSSEFAYQVIQASQQDYFEEFGNS